MTPQENEKIVSELPASIEPHSVSLQTDTSPTIGKIGLAMAKAQLSIHGAIRDSQNPYFKSTYADLAAVWDSCHTPINENEIGIFQLPSADGTKINVVTLLVHSSGEWIRSNLSVVSKASDAQAVGSAITYCRRYALSAMVGVCPIDDDGEAAMGRKGKEEVASIKPTDAHKKNVEDCKKIVDRLVAEKAPMDEIGKVVTKMQSAKCTREEIKYATGIDVE